MNKATMMIREISPRSDVVVCGKRATLVFVNECRARIRYLEGVTRSFVTRAGQRVEITERRAADISPTTEVEVDT